MQHDDAALRSPQVSNRTVRTTVARLAFSPTPIREQKTKGEDSRSLCLLYLSIPVTGAWPSSARAFYSLTFIEAQSTRDLILPVIDARTELRG